MKSRYQSRGYRSLVTLATTLALASCSGSDTASDATADQSPMSGSDAGAMSGMGGMQGMQGMGNGGMMDQMQSHMRMMDGAGADSIASMLPTHRQMVANMIAQFNKEMRDMNMSTNTEWNATVDSLRADLTQMPDMRATELQQFMSAHNARVTRLMESHRKMMSDMKM